MPTYTDVTGNKHLLTCSDCPPGTLIMGEMKDEHDEWHADNPAVVQDLSHLGGANDPGPMPEDER